MYLTQVPNTNIVLGLLKNPFQLNEYVNPVCIPSYTWVPLAAQCRITGKLGDTLNHNYQTQVIGVCEYENNNKYKLCTQQDNPTNECLYRWSGALVCSDSNGFFYAVGIYYSENGNCGLPGEPAPDRYAIDPL